MDADAIQEDTQAALETLQDLQSQFEAVGNCVQQWSTIAKQSNDR